jgi:hypothetical protein
MCGIFGAVATPGKKINLGIIYALTWANRERGTDSAGFFDSTGKMTKRAGDPSDVLRKGSVQKWLKASQGRGWFIAGHTRFATRGSVNRRNSHPFRYGRIIGSHNGMIDAPNKFKVDSEYLFWLLNKHWNDYNKALGDVSGYWGLCWYDGEDFYLMCHSGELAVVEIDGVYYFSSSWKHLDSCTGGDSHTFAKGEVWKFSSDGTVSKSTVKDSGVKPFVSTAPDHWGGYGRYCGYSGRWNDDEWTTGSTRASSSTGHRRNRSSGGRGGLGKKASQSWWEEQEVDAATGVRDYDQEWADAWASYCSDDEGTDEYAEAHKSIHSMTDDEYEDHERYAG